MYSMSVADTLMLTIRNIGDAPIVINPIADIEVDEDSEPAALNINGVFDDFDISVVATLSASGPKRVPTRLECVQSDGIPTTPSTPD